MQAGRIVDHASAGDVVVSDTVMQLAAGKGFRFEPLGQVELKGLEDTSVLWRVVGP